jgi:hypothetical protein
MEIVMVGQDICTNRLCDKDPRCKPGRLWTYIQGGKPGACLVVSAVPIWTSLLVEWDLRAGTSKLLTFAKGLMQFVQEGDIIAPVAACILWWDELW